MIKVHMIDDDEDMHELLTDYFEDESIAFTASASPLKGLDYLNNNAVDLVLLDFMMPEMDGFETYRRLRADHALIPVIMLTAKKDDYNKIIGLELGIDDYLPKPFNPRELLARIKSIMRRFERSQQFHSAQSAEPKIETLTSEKHALVMDLSARQVTLKNEVLEMTSTEFDMLSCLMQHTGIVLSREVLMDKVKGIDFEAFDRTIDVFISRLRQKLECNPKKPEIIKTVRGVGYIFTR